MAGVTFSLSVTADGIEKTIDRFQTAKGAWKKVIKSTVKSEGETLVSLLRQEYMSGRPGIISRTGTLKRSLKSKVVSTNDSIALTIGSDSPYFPLQRMGGTIVPTAATFLAIPMGGGLTGTGRRRFFPSPKYYPGQFTIAKGAGGKLFLRSVTSGDVTHRLVRSVYVPPRLTWDTYIYNFAVYQMFPKIRDQIIETLEGPLS